MPRPVVNILISVEPETVQKVEELLEHIRKIKISEMPLFRFAPLTEDEQIEHDRLVKSRPAAYVNLWLTEVNKRKKKEYRELRKGNGISSRRALIVRLIEVGLKHAEEV